MNIPPRPDKPRTASLTSLKNREHFKKTIAKARARNVHRRPEDIEAEIDQALDEVRAERFGNARPKSPRR